MFLWCVSEHFACGGSPAESRLRRRAASGDLPAEVEQNHYRTHIYSHMLILYSFTVTYIRESLRQNSNVKPWMSSCVCAIIEKHTLTAHTRVHLHENFTTSVHAQTRMYLCSRRDRSRRDQLLAHTWVKISCKGRWWWRCRCCCWCCICYYDRSC